MMIKRFSRHGFTSNHERDARASWEVDPEKTESEILRQSLPSKK